MQADFDRFADSYEELLRDPVRDHFRASPDFYHRRKWILIEGYLRRIGFPLATAAWLDAGCGKGELLSIGKPHFARVAGCDPSSRMRSASTSAVEVLHQPSPGALPFPDASFDFVTAVNAYHHVEEPDRLPLTRDVFRVLRPGGVFCMIEHNPWNPVTQGIVRRTPVDADARLLSVIRARRYLRQGQFHVIGSQFFLYLPEKLFTRARFVETWLTALPLGGQYAVFARKPA